jgi:hypothetical protein
VTLVALLAAPAVIHRVRAWARPHSRRIERQMRELGQCTICLSSTRGRISPEP